MVERVGHVDGAVRTDRDAAGTVEAGSGCRAVLIASGHFEARREGLPASGEGRDGAVGRDLADALAARIGDVDRAAAFVDRDVDGKHELGLVARTIDVSGDAVAREGADLSVRVDRRRKGAADDAPSFAIPAASVRDRARAKRFDARISVCSRGARSPSI